jgi:hypothetical protein
VKQRANHRTYWALCLALVAALAVPVPVAHAVYVQCIVRPSPTAAGVAAAYAIDIGSNPYDRIDQLRLTLPFDTGFSASNIGPSTVLVNGIPCRGGTIVKKADNAIRVDIMLQQRLVKGQPIAIAVSREAGLTNPISPRSCYRMTLGFVRDGTELAWIESDQYAITPSALGSLGITIDPPVVGAAGSYDVQFITGSNGRIKAGQDYIMIAFPAGFSLPQSFSMTDVTLNGVSCAGRVYRASDEPNAIQIYTPIDVSSDSLVSIRIPAKAGIKNSGTTGLAILSVWTSIESFRVDAPPIIIMGRQVVEATLRLQPPVAGAAVEMTFDFKTSPVGRLLAGQRVMMRLPSAFALPLFTTGVTCVVNQIEVAVQVDNGVVTATIPAFVPDNGRVIVTLPVGLGIINPAGTGGYVVEVWTDADMSPAVVLTSVQAPSPAAVSLAVSTRAVGRVAAWTVSFAPSSPARLPAAGDAISLVFDEHIIVPQTIAPDSATVNGVPASLTVAGALVAVTVPQGVPVADRITVVLAEDAGIRTPPTEGQYGVTVATTRDATYAAGNSIDFRILPVVTIVVTPDAPSGQNGYYIGTRPTVKLVGDAFSMYYKLDDAGFQPYTTNTPLSIGEGTHALSCYAVTQDGIQGDVTVRSFVVDLTVPKVTIQGSSGDVLVNSSQVTLRGTVSEPVDVLQFNGVPARVAEDLTFDVALTVADGQALACFARDVAGNPTSSIRTVRIDGVAPVIARDSLQLASATVHTNQYNVIVTVSESAAVTVNGLPMTMAGIAWHATVPLATGPNEIVIKAVDRAGNESVLAWTVAYTDLLEIELRVGEATARVGDELRVLDAPPVVVNGVTFVPLRFIGEALGSSVQWNDALKVVFLERGTRQLQLTIGSKLAIVDGEIVELLEAPRIVNGRTMVPIRFISEAFGADVQWDPETRGVSITVDTN